MGELQGFIFFIIILPKKSLLFTLDIGNTFIDRLQFRRESILSGELF